MRRRALLTMLVLAVATGGQALADEPVQRILRDLKKLGYRTVSVETTLLRRTRIVAQSDEAQREIIVNPHTGEILRDLWIPIKVSGDGTGGAVGDNSGSGSGSDDDDDDDGDDNSGHGNGGDDSGGDDSGGDDSGGDDSGGDDSGGNSGSGGNGGSGGGSDDD